MPEIRIETQLVGADKVVGEVDRILASIKGFVETLSRIAEGPSASMSEPVRELNEAVGALEQAFANLAGQAGLTGALDNMANLLDDLAAAIGTLAPQVEGFGEVFFTVLGTGGTVLVALKAFRDAFQSLVLASGPIGLFIAAASTAVAAWTIWGDDVTRVVRETVGAMRTWLVDRFADISEAVRGKVADVAGFFKELWDKVSRNSFVPDMVRDIARWFARLPEVMVEPARRATAEVAEAFSRAGGITRETAEGTEAQKRAFDDLGAHVGAVAGRMQGAFARFFTATLRGGASLGEGLKGLFGAIADTILAEFARLAGDRVFRVLFGDAGLGREAGRKALAGAPGGGLLGALAGTGSGGLLGRVVPGSLQPFLGPAIGGALGLIAGDVKKAVASVGLGVGGALAFGPVGGLLGATLGGLFQTGGERIFTRPSLIAVGEVAPERVRVEPLAGAAPAGAGLTVNVAGPLVMDEIGLAKFERVIERAVRSRQRRRV